MASAGALFPTGVAPIMAMQLSTAIKLKLKARMILAVVCHIVKRLNAEDGMGTYKRLGRILYSRAEKCKLGRCED